MPIYNGFWLGKKRPAFCGESHPNWKGGKPKCLGCGKITSGNRYKRCMSCSAKSKIFTNKHRANISNAKRGIPIPSMADEKHNQWKGTQASYSAKHNWIARKLGKPSLCQGCGRDGLSGHQIHWANVSGQYLRELDDWIRLCAKCHHAFDNLSQRSWESRRKNAYLSI